MPRSGPRCSRAPPPSLTRCGRSRESGSPPLAGGGAGRKSPLLAPRRARRAPSRAREALSDRIRILRVIARLNIGGPAYHVSLLGGLLDPDRYETLLVAGGPGPGEGSFEGLARRYGARLELLQSLSPEIDPLADA